MRNKRSALESESTVAAAERGHEDTGGAVAAAEVADIERLMDGFREEVQKLDEGLRMLSAYVSGLRKRTRRSADETLH